MSSPLHASTRSDLETTRPSATTSTLELAALALDIRLLVGVGTEAEVLERLTRVLGSTEEEGVGSGWEAGGDLVDGQGLTTSSLDARAGGGGESESSNGQLGELEQTDVVGDGANLSLVSLCLRECKSEPYDDDSLALVSL